MRITYTFLLLTLLFSFISGCSMFVLSWPLLLDFVPVPLLQTVQSKLIVSTLVISVLLVLGITGASLFMTHRIAGAIHHIEQHLDAVLQGQQPPPLRLRPNDGLQQVAGKLNAFTQAYYSCVNSSSATTPVIPEESATQL